MAEITKNSKLDGYNRSNMIIKQQQPVDGYETNHNVDGDNDNTDSSQNINKMTKAGGEVINRINRQSSRASSSSRTKFYIDELGFYRHLDPDQRQYVCSNLNSVRSQTKSGINNNNITTSSTTATNTSVHHNNKNHGINHHHHMKTLLSMGDGGYEICFHSIRNDLGISHFDRTVGYEEWKQSWDDFMRAKLIKQEPVTLNRELKTRVRSGIPHDYRCKVWTALIRMRTKSMRANHGEDIYDILLRDYVRKVDIPEYRPDSDSNQATTDPNNNGAKVAYSISSKQRRSRTSQLTCPASSSSSIGTAAAVNGRPILHEATSKTANRQQQPQQQQQVQSQTNQACEANNPEPFIEKCFKQIELDLLRTLPNNRHFEDPNSRGIRRVRNVLRAYACFNPTVGYCQGMNRLAAMALLVLPEEEAFWCLVAIIQCIMPKDYYLKPWLAQVDCNVLSDLLEKKMPKLHKHLAKNDIQLTLFTWFFTIFVDGFRPELMLRIWDCFLLEGDKVLFRIALAILNISQDDLLRMNDFSTMSSHLSRLVSTRKLDMEQLFETFNTMNPLSTGLVQSRRDYHRNRMQMLIDD